MEDALLGGASVMAMIIGWVEFVKSFDADPRIATVIGILFAVGLGLLDQWMKVNPALAPWVLTVVQYMALGMAATGLYKVSKKFRN